jgi:hypothetical protein
MSAIGRINKITNLSPDMLTKRKWLARKTLTKTWVMMNQTSGILLDFKLFLSVFKLSMSLLHCCDLPKVALSTAVQLKT